MALQGSVVRFVLPLVARGLAVDSPKHNTLRDILNRDFGGYTMYNAAGSWMAEGSKVAAVETVMIYEVMVMVSSETARYSKVFEKARAVWAELYDKAPTMTEQAVYFTVNTTAHILSAAEARNSDLYRPTPKEPPFAKVGDVLRQRATGEVWYVHGQAEADAGVDTGGYGLLRIASVNGGDRASTVCPNPVYAKAWEVIHVGKAAA